MKGKHNTRKTRKVKETLSRISGKDEFKYSKAYKQGFVSNSDKEIYNSVIRRVKHANKIQDQD